MHDWVLKLTELSGRRESRLLSRQSWSQRLNNVANRTGPDDAVAFGIKRHAADGRPVAGVAGPTRGVEFASLGVQGMSGSQDCVIAPFMALSRTDITNTTMTMIKVAPTHVAGRLGAGAVEVGKAPGGELGPVLGRAKQRLGVGVVVAHARSGVRGLNSQPVEHHRYRRRLERVAVAPMPHVSRKIGFKLKQDDSELHAELGLTKP